MCAGSWYDANEKLCFVSSQPWLAAPRSWPRRTTRRGGRAAGAASALARGRAPAAAPAAANRSRSRRSRWGLVMRDSTVARPGEDGRAEYTIRRRTILRPAPQPLAEPPEGLLLGRLEHGQVQGHDAGVDREDPLDQAPAAGGEVDVHEAAVLRVALSARQAAPLEVAHDQGHVAAALEQLRAQVALGQRAQEEQRLEDSELAHGQVDVAQVLVDADADG